MKMRRIIAFLLIAAIAASCVDPKPDIASEWIRTALQSDQPVEKGR